MKNGLVFGKFLPPHKGHLALIHFALQHCDQLTILVCHCPGDPISGPVRTQWLQQDLQDFDNITIQGFAYDETILPNTSVSSREVSRLWSAAFQKTVHGTDIVFSSEPYGEFVAEYMQIQHISFDPLRRNVPVAASQIMALPFHYWDFITASAKPWFVKKIVLLGSESTGKSTLTRLLAEYFNTAFVPEMAREIIEKTEECTVSDLTAIASLHAEKIIAALPFANKFLFIDTDLSITQSYSRFLFQQELEAASWIVDANKADLYFFLETDCPFVQDGTRLNEAERNQLSLSHKVLLQEKEIFYHSVKGSWTERLSFMIAVIEKEFFVAETASS